MIIVAQQHRLFVVFTHILLALLSDVRIICQQIWREVHRAGVHFALHITKNRRWIEALARDECVKYIKAVQRWKLAHQRSKLKCAFYNDLAGIFVGIRPK